MYCPNEENDSSNLDYANEHPNVIPAVWDQELAVNPVQDSKLYVPLQPGQLPIVYSEDYNISLFGLESLHSFDSRKWGRVFEFLKDAGMLNAEMTVKPVMPSRQDLRIVHTDYYLQRIKCPCVFARVMEVGIAVFIPRHFLVQRVLKPLRLHTGGTVAAAALAMDGCWGINLGGGFHHASYSGGGGFCAYADISIAIMWLHHHAIYKLRRVIIIDLDAHRGNGYARDFKAIYDVFVFDMFAHNRYPLRTDKRTQRYIDWAVPLRDGTSDKVYMEELKWGLYSCRRDMERENWEAQLIVYNAGTDCLRGDALGGLDLSPQAIVNRDEYVFRFAYKYHIPIVMLLSGGYTRQSARVIADSIINLHQKNLLPENGQFPVITESFVASPPSS